MGFWRWREWQKVKKLLPFSDRDFEESWFGSWASDLCYPFVDEFMAAILFDGKF